MFDVVSTLSLVHRKLHLSKIAKRRESRKVVPAARRLAETTEIGLPRHTEGIASCQVVDAISH